MKKKAALFLATALLLSAGFADAKALGKGDALPKKDVALRDVSGKDVTLASLGGAKGTLVVFTCNECPFAKAWEDRIVALGNEFVKKGIGVALVNSNEAAGIDGDSLAEMKDRAKAKSMGFAYVTDPGQQLADAFGAGRTPEAFLFDASGKLVYHGTVDDNAQEPSEVKKTYLRDALTAVASGAAPAVAETKAVGCGIKRKKA
jgi:peroxiredoxin